MPRQIPTASLLLDKQAVASAALPWWTLQGDPHCILSSVRINGILVIAFLHERKPTTSSATMAPPSVSLIHKGKRAQDDGQCMG